MRDSTGEPPDGFQFLGQIELLFELLAFRDIAIDDDKLLRLSVGVANRAGGGFKNPPVSALVPDAVFEAAAHSRAPGFLRRCHHRRSILRVDLFKRGGSYKLFGGVAERSLVRRAVVEPLPIDAHHCDHVRCVFADQSKELFPLCQPNPEAMNL